MASEERSPAARAGLARDGAKATVEAYRGFYDEAAGGGVRVRRQRYRALVTQFYDLVTDFYVFGWGESFHFAPRRRGEGFRASLARQERFLAEQLGLRPGVAVLDVGCGVGGPMREIARHSGARVVGVNASACQVRRGRAYNRRAGLGRQCALLNADFMQIPAADNAFDAAYAFAATPHAPDRAALFREVRRVMRPGACFAGYEWCLTDRYDPDNPDHRRIKGEIEEGNALPALATAPEVIEALGGAGFEVVAFRDVAPESDPETPWYRALAGHDLSLRGLPRTPMGRRLTNRVVRLLEFLRVAPEGTAEVSAFLNRSADALVAGGETGIFTPMFYFLARKR
jgi:sterol 24-C-methyltransferase